MSLGKGKGGKKGRGKGKTKENGTEGNSEAMAGGEEEEEKIEEPAAPPTEDHGPPAKKPKTQAAASLVYAVSLQPFPCTPSCQGQDCGRPDARVAASCGDWPGSAHG